MIQEANEHQRTQQDQLLHRQEHQWRRLIRVFIVPGVKQGRNAKVRSELPPADEQAPERYPEHGEDGWTMREVLEVLAREGALKKI